MALRAVSAASCQPVESWLPISGTLVFNCIHWVSIVIVRAHLTPSKRFAGTMMSAPEHVQVDHPGARGIGPGLSGITAMGNSGSTTADSNSPDSSGALSVEDPPNHPWTIGSTEGVSAGLQHSPQNHHDDPTNSFPDQVGNNVSESPPPPFRGGAAIGTGGEATAATTLQTLTNGNSAMRSLFHDRLFRQPSLAVESVLGASCEVMGFDIAELWLRTGPRTHQLINSHLRPASLEESVRNELVEVYYGERASERTHRLSPALCKRAKEAMDVVWVTALTPHGAEALRCSINDVRTAVAIPICHAFSNTNLTVIFFSIRRQV
jgi:hypothetical protein